VGAFADCIFNSATEETTKLNAENKLL